MHNGLQPAAAEIVMCRAPADFHFRTIHVEILTMKPAGTSSSINFNLSRFRSLIADKNDTFQSQRQETL